MVVGTVHLWVKSDQPVAFKLLANKSQQYHSCSLLGLVVLWFPEDHSLPISGSTRLHTY